MAQINAYSGSVGSSMSQIFMEPKQHSFFSVITIENTDLKIEKNEKNEITKIILPWTFYLKDGSPNNYDPAYAVRHYTILEIDESNDKLTKKQLDGLLRLSYDKLYNSVYADSLLKHAIDNMPDFSPNSIQSEQNIQSALIFLSKLLSL